MLRFLSGAISALILLTVGFFFWSGIAERDAPSIPDAPPPPTIAEEGLPTAIGADALKMGPAPPSPPEAPAKSREERRFARYDRDRDGNITRVEMMSSRSKAFRKLDKNDDNLLTFEEWAARTSNRFATADADKNGELTAAEFATTRPKRKAPARCKC